MKWLVVIFFSVFSFASFGQEVVELGVKFTLKDSLLNIDSFRWQIQTN